MRQLFAALLASAALASPVWAAPAKDTDAAARIRLADTSGEAVSQLLIRGGYDGYRVLDPTHVLLDSPHHEFFLVTFEKPCDWMDFVNAFDFVPGMSGWVRSNDMIYAHAYKGSNCYVSKVQQVTSRDEGRALAKAAVESSPSGAG